MPEELEIDSMGEQDASGGDFEVKKKPLESWLPTPAELKFGTPGFKILMVILGALVFAGAVFSAFKLGQSQVRPEALLEPTPTPVLIVSPAPDTTLNWPTYQNIEYGFTIKYPLEYSPKDLGSKTVAFFLNIDEKELQKMTIYMDFAGGWGCTQVSSTKEMKVGNETGRLEVHTPMTGDSDCQKFDPDQSPFATFTIGQQDLNWLFQYSIEKENREVDLENFKKIISTFKILTKEKLSFRIDKEGDKTRVVVIRANGQEKVLREYQFPNPGPARELYSSPENRFLAIDLGTGAYGSLEVVSLEDEKTITSLTKYGKVLWLDVDRLVLNVPEIVEPPRPYEGSAGFSLATFDAALNQYRILKKADANTDYVLEKIENQEIFFKKVVASDPETWLKLRESHWRINFEGTLEKWVS